MDARRQEYEHMCVETIFQTYIAEVDLLTECGRSVRYTSQCKASDIPDPETILDVAVCAALAYHPGAEVLESRMRRT